MSRNDLIKNGTLLLGAIALTLAFSHYALHTDQVAASEALMKRADTAPEFTWAQAEAPIATSEFQPESEGSRADAIGQVAAISENAASPTKHTTEAAVAEPTDVVMMGVPRSKVAIDLLGSAPRYHLDSEAQASPDFYESQAQLMRSKALFLNLEDVQRPSSAQKTMIKQALVMDVPIVVEAAKNEAMAELIGMGVTADLAVVRTSEDGRRIEIESHGGTPIKVTTQESSLTENGVVDSEPESSVLIPEASLALAQAALNRPTTGKRRSMNQIPGYARKLFVVTDYSGIWQVWQGWYQYVVNQTVFEYELFASVNGTLRTKKLRVGSRGNGYSSQLGTGPQPVSGMQYNTNLFRGFYLERASIYTGPQEADPNNYDVYSTGTYAPQNVNNQVTVTETTSTTVGVNGSLSGGSGGPSGGIGGSFSATESSSVSFTIQDFACLVETFGATSRGLGWNFFLKKVGVGEEYFTWQSLIEDHNDLYSLPLLANGLGVFSPQTDGYWETQTDKTGLSNFIAMTASYYRSVALTSNPFGIVLANTASRIFQPNVSILHTINWSSVTSQNPLLRGEWALEYQGTLFSALCLSQSSANTFEGPGSAGFYIRGTFQSNDVFEGTIHVGPTTPPIGHVELIWDRDLDELNGWFVTGYQGSHPAFFPPQNQLRALRLSFINICP